MVRTKIEINVSALGQRTKTMSMTVGSNTTTADVIHKVLEKYRIEEPQAMYQLLAVLKTDSGSQGRVLENGDQPSQIVQQSKSPIQFHLHPSNSNPGPAPHPPTAPSSLGSPSTQTSSNNLIRVHYQLQHGVQSFASLIITPSMTAKEVLELAVSKALPSEPASNFSLMLATSKGDIIQIRDDDYPYTMSNGLNRFELKRRTATNPLLPPHPPSTSHTSPAAPLSSSSSASHLTTPSYTHDLSTSQLLKGKVQLHGELIEALRKLTAQSQVGGLLETSSGQSRETVLEQALVEQNQILDVMQDLVSTLESENLHYRESITAQNKLVQSLSGWEAKAMEVERELELLSQQQQDMKVAELKKQLEEKNQTILTLQSRLQSESGNSNSLLMAKLSSTRTKLEMERVRCIELEEKVSQAKDDLSKMKRKMAENESIVTSKDSEIQHLKYEIASLRTFEEQQQELVMKQRTSLANQDIQLSSLTRALNKEKKVADQLRRLQLSTSTLLPKVRNASVESLDSDSPSFQPSFFEQISDREIHTVELSRITSETELGFSFSKVDLPISSQVPCLIVKAVKEGSIAEGWLEPGDELVEVNGIACRSARQSRAVRMLEQAVGLLKLVVAREPKVRSSKLQYSHSTPKVPNGPDFSAIDQDTSGGNRTALWATALSPTKIESFSVVETEPGANSNPEFVTVPEVYSISVAKESEGSASGDQMDASEVASQEKPSVDEYGKLSVSSSLVTLNSREEAARRKYQSEIAELQDQLDESEHIRLNLESELNSTRDEASHLQEDYQVAKAENQELLQQVSNYESEMGNVSKHISDLQTALMTLQAQVTDEQQKLASMDNLNRVISGELVGAKDAASQAVKARETLEQELKGLKEELERKEERTNMVQELEMENDRLVSEIDRMGGEASTLRNTLESCKKSYEDTIAGLKLKQKELESQLEVARKVSESSTLSSQEEYQHLTAQLKSAKSLLKEAEMKDSQQKVEMRYLKQAADLANNELKKLETECQKVKEELGFFKQQAENDTIELQSLTLNLKNTQMKLEAKQAIIERLQGEGDSLRRTNSKLKTENFELNEHVKKLEVDLKVSSMEEDRLIEKLGAMEAEKDDIFQQLESSLDESNDLSIKMEQATTRLRELEDAGEISVKLEAKTTAQDEMMESLKASEAKLQHEVEVSQRKAEQLTQQISKMKEELKQLEGQCDRATKSLIQAQTENEQLTSLKDELHKQLAELQDIHTTLSKEVEARELEMADTRSALLKAQEQAKLGEERLEESRLKVVKLESELKAAEEEKAKTESKASSLEFIQAQDQSNIEELRKSLAEKDQEIQRLGDQIEQLNTLVQKIKVEQTALTSLQTTTQHQLEESRKVHLEEVTELKEKVASKQRQLSLQNDEINAQESRSEMLRDKIEHLSVSLEKMDKEKTALNSSIDVLTQENSELQSQNAQLHSRMNHLKSELDRLTMSTDSLSSETAGLRKQAREYEKELDQLTALLHATEMNLEIASRSLKDREEMNSTQSENMANLEALYQATQSKLEEVEAVLEKTSMELFTKQEELSKASAGLKLRQTECTQLQESLIAVQAKADSYKEQSSELEAEKERLLLQISQLETVEKNLEESLSKLKEEKTNDAQQYSDEIEKCQKELEAFQLKEKAHAEETAVLNTSLEEARASITQLLSTQEETKKSIRKIGDEKDRDIINLRDEVETLKSQVDTLTGTLTSSSKSQDLLKEEIHSLQQNNDALQQKLAQEAEEANKLKEELKVHQEIEEELEKLNSRVTTLDDNLKEKSRKIAELESKCHSTELQLESVESENKELLEKAVELSELKISMAEQEKNLDKLRKSLAETETAHKQLLEERTQLLSRVREFEVQKHAAQNQPEPVAQSHASSPADEELESRDISTILQSLHQMEEEVARTRAYTENLLINVMTSAPFLLEKLR